MIQQSDRRVTLCPSGNREELRGLGGRSTAGAANLTQTKDCIEEGMNLRADRDRRSYDDGRAVSLDLAAIGAYVLSRRTPSGGYSYYRTPAWGVEEPNAPDTFAALESLRLLGLEVPEPDQTRTWLRSLQDAQGGFVTLTVGWAALRALALIGAGPVGSPLRWIAHNGRIISAHKPDAAWPEVLRNALRLVELLDLVGLSDVATIDVGRLLTAAWDRDGGWAVPGADLETTAVGLVLSDRAGAPVDAGAIATFLRRCEDPALGLRLRPDAGATSIGALVGGLVVADRFGLALSHPGAIADSLAILQRADGGLGARHRAISTLEATAQGLAANRLLDQYWKERQ